jgi:hypothetical protein
MKFIKFYSVAFFKMKILWKFTSFLNFLFLEAAAMDISDSYYISIESFWKGESNETL